MKQDQKWLGYVAELREKHDKEIQDLKEHNATLKHQLSDQDIEMQTAVRLLQTCIHENLPINEAIDFVQAYWNKHNIFPYEP